ncbi:hypothetical protein HCUR_00494 [Holospora curviuscula]|uniref:Uncharacterized protein n=1 Tax=Holospora curviuscula TaxID=1082868 RepID=A0A2S5R9F5_9PROT|nr:hypothetical protein HCUR_00494 [Holospora curviuscula]
MDIFYPAMHLIQGNLLYYIFVKSVFVRTYSGRIFGAIQGIPILCPFSSLVNLMFGGELRECPVRVMFNFSDRFPLDHQI